LQKIDPKVVKEIDKFAPSLNWHIYHGPSRELVLNEVDIDYDTLMDILRDLKHKGKLS